MANVIELNYAYLDTFTADIVISKTFIKVIAMTVCAFGGPELAVFVNSKHNPVLIGGGVETIVDHFTPSQPIGLEGLVYSSSLSTLEAGDRILLHFA